MMNNSFDQEKFEMEVKQVKRFAMSTAYGFVNADTYYNYAMRKTEQTPLMSFVDLVFIGLDYVTGPINRGSMDEKDKNNIIRIMLDTFTIFKDAEDLNAIEFADKYGVLIDGKNGGGEIRKRYTMEYIRKAGYNVSVEGLKSYLQFGRDEDYERYVRMRQDFWREHFFTIPYGFNPVKNPYPSINNMF